jgi:LysM repeat protein
LKGNSLRAGRSLRIYRPTEAEEPSLATRTKSKGHTKASLQLYAKVVPHKVKKGETLSSIADNYNTTVAALRKANGKVASHLQAGTVLVVRQAE